VGGRWPLRYALSFRDVEELMRERGLRVDHTTVFRWVQRSRIVKLFELAFPLEVIPG
jgi:transposase-like protein